MIEEVENLKGDWYDKFDLYKSDRPDYEIKAG